MSCIFCDPRCPEWKTSKTGLQHRITDYLSNGGLFNPSEMEGEKVRELILDLRDYLARLNKDA